MFDIFLFVRSDITDLSISSTHVVGLESSGAVLVFKESILMYFPPF